MAKEQGFWSYSEVNQLLIFVSVSAALAPLKLLMIYSTCIFSTMLDLSDSSSSKIPNSYGTAAK